MKLIVVGVALLILCSGCAQLMDWLYPDKDGDGNVDPGSPGSVGSKVAGQSGPWGWLIQLALEGTGVWWLTRKKASA